MYRTLCISLCKEIPSNNKFLEFSNKFYIITLNDLFHFNRTISYYIFLFKNFLNLFSIRGQRVYFAIATIDNLFSSSFYLVFLLLCRMFESIS